MTTEYVSRLANKIANDADQFGELSAGEQIAVALLHGDLGMLPTHFRHPLDAIQRLGAPDMESVMEAHALGWRRAGE